MLSINKGTGASGFLRLGNNLQVNVVLPEDSGP